MAKRAYMPIYIEHVKVIKDMVTAEQLRELKARALEGTTGGSSR